MTSAWLTPDKAARDCPDTLGGEMHLPGRPSCVNRGTERLARLGTFGNPEPWFGRSRD